MLCKITMRAALAPVIGLFGVLFATAVGAEINLTGTGTDAPKALKYASESLHKDEVEKVGSRSYYKLMATPMDLIISATTDLLLPAGDRYYVRYDFTGGAALADDLSPTHFGGVPAESGTATGTPSATDVAAGGRRGDSYVVFVLNNEGFGRDTGLTLDLSTTDATRTDSALDDPAAMLAVSDEGTIQARLRIFNDYQNALAANGALFDTGGVNIIEVKRAVTASIKSAYDTAEVATEVADGGPFRRFVDDDEKGGTESGVLGMVTVEVDTSLRDAQANQNGSGMITNAIVHSIAVKATSDAGNFAVSLGKDGILNTKAAGGKPWMLAKTSACKSGPLNYDATNLDTYDDDPDGKDGPLAKGNLTPDGIQAVTAVSGTVRDDGLVGTRYFCVLVTGNTEPIPEIGDPMEKGSYNLTVTPVFADSANRLSGNAESGDVGAIVRNGTTVNVTYLTTNPFVDQRLVLVNRGADAVMFWVDDFNLEDKTDVTRNDLKGPHVLPGRGRMVYKINDVIEFEGQARGSATVNVAAPERDIDVMTVQRSPFTDEVDTTLY